MFEFIWICEWRNTDIRLISFLFGLVIVVLKFQARTDRIEQVQWPSYKKKSSQATTTATVLQAKYTNSV